MCFSLDTSGLRGTKNENKYEDTNEVSEDTLYNRGKGTSQDKYDDGLDVVMKRSQLL